MFNLTIAANTAEELRLKVLDLVNQFKAVNVMKDGEAIPAEAPKEVKPVISQAQMEENVQKAPQHEAPEQPTIEEIRAAMKELRDRKGAEAVREILKAFGADNLSKLKPEDYLGALARAKTEV